MPERDGRARGPDPGRGRVDNPRAASGMIRGLAGVDAPALAAGAMLSRF
jgi:hypothetical protein